MTKNEGNRQKTSPGHQPTNSQDRFFQTNTIPKTILPAKYCFIVRKL